MGFSRKKKKIRNTIITLVCILMLLAVAYYGYILVSKKINDIETVYIEKIDNLKIEHNKLKRKVFIPRIGMKRGTIIRSSLVEEKEIFIDIDKTKLINKQDMNKMLLVDVKVGEPIFKNMVAKERVNKGVREQELSMIFLKSNLKNGDYIDVRIVFHNADNYIVLSKKKIREIDLEQNTVFLWLDEEEILTLNSAIVDAYINKGANLYTVSYVQPNIQESSIVTYPVKANVLELIKNNPNIVNIAKTILDEEVRKQLNKRLVLTSHEDISSVSSGIKQEKNIRTEKITKTKEIIAVEEKKQENKQSEKEGYFNE
ncbi:hypothetical protein PV797_04425 [Clostridiaceae bacterium M8S5]|nr:hypothetical protein PV797_04425 [Clostridiaceae bacterium M8S5]